MYCHALYRSRAACARSRPPGGCKPRKHLYTARTPSGRGAGRRALAMDAAAGALEARHRPARAPVSKLRTTSVVLIFHLTPISRNIHVLTPCFLVMYHERT